MESFWWTTFDGLYWWTCIVDDQSNRWSWHFSKRNDVWSSSKCQKIAMWVQFYSCLTLDRTCKVESKWELPRFSFFLKKTLGLRIRKNMSIILSYHEGQQTKVQVILRYKFQR
jgi:hypothetical protein